MKQVKTLPGVVLISVCDEHLLVATREARKTVPYVRQINSAGGFYWSLLEKGIDPNEIIRQAAVKYQIPGKQAAAMVVSFVNKLYKAGYVTVQDVEESK